MIQRLCLDASAYISDVVHGHAASIRFSGTVSPLALYQRLHGCAEDEDERAVSPSTLRRVLYLSCATYQPISVDAGTVCRRE